MDDIGYSFLLILSLIALCLLLYRLGKLYGNGFVLTIVIYGLYFFWIKEFLQQKGCYLPHVYSFKLDNVLHLGPVPLAAVFGSIFTFCLALSLGQRILSNLSLPANGAFLTSIVVIITMAISYAIEQAGTLAGWWIWGDSGIPWWDDPSSAWMGEISLLVTDFTRYSTGDVPGCSLPGWGASMQLFLFPMILANLIFKNRSWNYKVAVLILAPCFIYKVEDYATNALLWFLIVLVGLFKNGNEPIFDIKPHEKTNIGYTARYGDVIAVLIFLSFVIIVEAVLGFRTYFFASWSPIALLTLFAFSPRRWSIISVIILCTMYLVFETFSTNAIWRTPLDLFAFYCLLLGQPLFIMLIHRLIWKHQIAEHTQ